MEIPPVTRESIQRAKADRDAEREVIFVKTGIRITDDPMQPFRVVVTRRISAYRHVKEQ